MNEPLPLPTPDAQQPEDRHTASIPWHAFAAGADVTSLYGQPSPALIARAGRGRRDPGDAYARTEPARGEGTA
ncbi:hypothetical protein ACFY7H_27280 [Streptomyces sp. NPDC012794]|uniref:hypothetical protein n=1 Tax=Streptomyces sp. NPDC012794 TaxID=3364850 RepID=UPI0036C2BABC